ncbi:MAG TPA: FtsQ-type POTRA domain-containing protein [Candidatus Baltobacteraceae bacterium]|nr:FtsQ-type POTRA domain-containing protein [Candidatus Baltobacteraceae bacterium]
MSALPVRGGGTRVARQRPPMRASAAHRAAERIGATVVLVAAVVALVGLTTSGAFSLAPGGLELVGAHYTDPAAVRQALGLDGTGRVNLLTLRTSSLEAALRALPAVDPARADGTTIAVELPDRLVVTLQERQPIITWKVGGTRYLVDVTGTVFAQLASDAPDPGLPLVDDQRSASAGLAVGASLDPSDLAAVRQLAAITPAFLGSAARALTLTVTDEEGFTMDAVPDLWHAVFGVYTATLRPPTIIPLQAQCLASILQTNLPTVHEPSLDVIRLAPTDVRCGTYTLKTAHPGPTPTPSGKP